MNTFMCLLIFKQRSHNDSFQYFLLPAASSFDIASKLSTVPTETNTKNNAVPASGVPGCILPAGQHEAPAWTAPAGRPASSLPLWLLSAPECQPASFSVSASLTRAQHT